MANLHENLGVVAYDDLFCENVPSSDVVTVKLTAAGVVARGTVISGTPGGADFAALAAAASSSKALYILADAVDTAEESVGIAYRTGHFNRNGVKVAEGYTLTAADEEMLRKSGILLTDALPY